MERVRVARIGGHGSALFTFLDSPALFMGFRVDFPEARAHSAEVTQGLRHAGTTGSCPSESDVTVDTMGR